MLELLLLGFFLLFCVVCYFFCKEEVFPETNDVCLFYLKGLIVLLLIHCIFICSSLLFNVANLFLIKGDPLFLFYGPLLFLYIKSNSYKQKREKRSLSLSPHFFIGFFILSGYLFLNIVYKSIPELFIEVFVFIIYVLSAFSILVYVIMSYQIVMISSSFKEPSIKLKYLKLITFLFFLSVLLFGYCFHDNSYITHYRFLILSFLVALIVFCIRFYFVQVTSVKSIESQSDSDGSVAVDTISLALEPPVEIRDVKYEKAKISDELLVEYDKRIMEVIVRSKMFLKPDLKLDDLANQTKISRYYLGQYFSRVHNLNFNQYINKLRIDYVLHYIQKQKSIDDLTVNELLAISAFNSRTSFFRSFKEFVGVPPSEYLEKLKKKTV